MPDAALSTDGLDAVLPDRVHRLRKSLGLTARQLEALAGLPKGAVGRMERGTRRIYAADLFRLAQATGHDLGYFYGTDDAPAPTPEAAERNRLLQAYGRIADPRMKRDVFELIETLAKQEPS